MIINRPFFNSIIIIAPSSRLLKSKEKGLENNKISTNNVPIKKANKKTSTSNSIEKFGVEVDESKEVDPENKLPKIITTEEEIVITDEIDHSRRKRRRS